MPDQKPTFHAFSSTHIAQAGIISLYTFYHLGGVLAAYKCLVHLKHDFWQKVDFSAAASAKIDFLTPIMAPPTLLRPPGGTKHCSPNLLARLVARKGIGAHSI